MTLREQLNQLEELLHQDIYSDAPEVRERVAQIHLLTGALPLAAELCLPSTAPMDADGFMRCAQCGRIATPMLVETGYSVRHHLMYLDATAGTVHARGFASLADVEEEADPSAYWLQCFHCGNREPFPQDLVIEWEGEGEESPCE
jgi:hypothetical protein